MYSYIFDGSFEGLLTSIYEAYYRREDPQDFLTEENPQISFFEKNFMVITDIEKAKKVYNAIKEKISHNALKDIYYVYLSDAEEGRYSLIHNYLKLGWKAGSSLEQHLCDDCVMRVQNISRRLTFECHRMLGLIRFIKLEGDIYYARFEPDNNIAGLIASHFTRRLSDQNWIIHDVKRNIAAMYNKKEWVLSDTDIPPRIEQNNREKIYQNLWKQYFKSISIKSKINPKLQKRCMPVRYWRFLTEKWQDTP